VSGVPVPRAFAPSAIEETSALASLSARFAATRLRWMHWCEAIQPRVRSKHRGAQGTGRAFTSQVIVTAERLRSVRPSHL